MGKNGNWWIWSALRAVGLYTGSKGLPEALKHAEKVCQRLARGPKNLLKRSAKALGPSRRENWPRGGINGPCQAGGKVCCPPRQGPFTHPTLLPPHTLGRLSWKAYCPLDRGPLHTPHFSPTHTREAELESLLSPRQGPFTLHTSPPTHTLGRLSWGNQ